MIQKPKPTSVYQAEILANLTQTGIRQTSPGGKARAFCDIVGDRLGDMETRQFVALSQTLLPFASGDSLDSLGEIYGLPRIPRADISVSTLEANFQFYVLRGTFGNINSGSDITVPPGTRILTGAGNGPVFVVKYAVILPAAASTQTFAADALDTGSAANTPSGVFTKHNFINYADSRFGTLLVTNNFGLVGGRDEEDDDSYRFRIQLKLVAKGGASEADLRLAVLQVPGVQDVVFKRLAGTYISYIFGVSPVLPPSLLALCQAALDDRTAYPITGQAVSPDLVGISFTTTARFNVAVSQNDRATIISNAVVAAQDYINNLGTGDPLIINDIADRVRNSDNRILDIGDPNKPLHAVFIWRTRVEGTRYSRFLIDNYTPAIGERIVVESTANAISITPA